MKPGEPYISKAEVDFDIRLDKYGDIVVLTLTGRLEGVACNVLQQYLVKVLATAIPTLLVVDLAGLMVADLYGRDILLAADRHAKASGGRMIVTGGGMPPVLADSALEGRASIKDALAELGRRRRMADG
ncbi:STAS domain-containing protein [Nonomuraea sp. NPDC052265]|uniref:STAS domain-containing protein n=1 Tax=Nonomuraea sp. NPDC052265 TaxID=3364374 RepID=UPI0037C8E799